MPRRDDAMKAWKIRRKADGLFSGGTAEPRFTTRGKTWNRKQDALASWREHVLHARKANRVIAARRPGPTRAEAVKGPVADSYTGKCEIVEYDMVEAGAFEPAIGSANEGERQG